MRQFSRVILLVCFVAPAAADPTTCNTSAPPIGANAFAGALPDRVIVKLTEPAADRAAKLPEYGLPAGLPELDRLLQGFGVEDGYRVAREHGVPVRDEAWFREVGLHRLYTLRLPEPDLDRVRRLVRELSRQPWVEYAEPSAVAEPLLTPNDPFFGDHWNLHNTGQTGGLSDADIDAPEGWDTETGNSTAVIAILDSGADLDHPDLAANLLPGFDFTDPGTPPDETQDHGTQVSGVAGAPGNNGTGVTGVCWNCAMMPLKITGQGGGSTDMGADAIRYAADNGADAINLSVAWGGYHQVIHDAIVYAEGLGTLTVAAIGNSGTREIFTPAIMRNAVAVGGTDEFDFRIFSYGDHIDVSAPGIDLPTTYPDAQYTTTFGGTSGSSPTVAGAVGLLRANDATLHVRELRHLLRLGADDQVGAGGEDTAGWDQYMGYGRLNVDRSLDLVPGPWLALDRPHYVCGGDLTVALKDTSATGPVDVTLTGSIGGDSETVGVTDISGGGYHEGAIPLSWTGKDGPVVMQDGKLDVQDGETVTATVAALSASASFDCFKEICPWSAIRPWVDGDCDGDGAGDPGEVWVLRVALRSDQTETFDATATLTTASPHVEILADTSVYENLIQLDYPDEDGNDDPFRVRFLSGAPVDGSATVTLSVAGDGWEADTAACSAEGDDGAITFPLNRDPGTAVQQWDFDDATPQGFTHAVAHGSGDLSECPPAPFRNWGDHWGGPVTDRSHSGSYSMRLGNGVSYSSDLDAGLASPAFTVPAGGGALGFYSWIHTEITPSGLFAVDGMTLEAKGTSDTTWSHLPEASYNADLNRSACDFFTPVPFGVDEVVDMFAGDGAGTAVVGDEFDLERQVDLSGFAGEEIQVRFRVGADPSVPGQGIWVDTVTVYDAWIPDTWPGTAPGNLQGDDTGCPASFDLSWDSVNGAGGYNVYRSQVSCADASGRADVYDTTATPSYSDTAVVEDVQYYYAVEGTQAGSGCLTERSCIPGGCLCVTPLDPQNLQVDKSGNDVLLSWTDPSDPSLTWNVYRDPSRDPAGWGAPLASNVSDEDAGTPGIQYTDVGGVPAGTVQHYLITAVNGCGESPLR